VHASVYAVNTAGAFVGALLAGFYLIPAFGLPATLKGSAFINLGAFGFFFIVAAPKKNKSVHRPGFWRLPFEAIAG